MGSILTCHPLSGCIGAFSSLVRYTMLLLLLLAFEVSIEDASAGIKNVRVPVVIRALVRVVNVAMVGLEMAGLQAKYDQSRCKRA